MAGNKPTTKIKNKDDRMKGKKVLVSSQSTSDGSCSSSPTKTSNDLSILRKSIPTTIIGFRQIKKLYDTATEEVQDLLTNECDLIYECRVCRNIFRSLANFLSHKRIYCKQKFNRSLHAHFMTTSFLNDDSTEIYASDEKSNSKIGSSVNGNKKDLTSIIDNLGNRDVNNKMGLLEYYDEVNYRIAQKDAFRTEQAIRLDDIESNKSAVFQTVVKKNGSDTNNEFILDEVIELHDMLWKENAVMGPDGRLLAVDAYGQIKEPKIISSKSSDDEDDIVKCDICSLEFRTKKTLLYHIKVKHSTTHMHYPCPSCSDIFATAGAVYRHLCKVHNNTMVTIRKLRDQILNKGFTLDNASKRMLCRMNKRSEEPVAKNEQQDDDAWMLDLALDIDTLRCNGCNRKFERRAALTSHQLICRSRTQNKKENADSEETTSRNVRKNKNSVKKLKERESTIRNETMNNSLMEFDDQNDENMINSGNFNSNLDEITSHDNLERTELSGGKPVEIKINKRKRQHTRKCTNDSLNYSEDLYWEMNDDGSLRAKKPKEYLNDTAESAEEELKRKMYSLINEKQLQCIPCKKKFPSLTNLKRHIALHMKWKRFQCGLCTAQFYHRSECVYHLGRTHNMMGDKKFVDALIIPIESHEAENHVDKQLLENLTEQMTKNDDEEQEILTDSQKNNIDSAIDDVLKYTEPNSSSNEVHDPLENNDLVSSSCAADSAENSDNKEFMDESISPLNEEVKEEDNSMIMPVRKRGRPRSVILERMNDEDDSREKRGRGRPKGSLNREKKKKHRIAKTTCNSPEDNEPEEDQPQDQDKMRKMVLEVIFGGEKKEESNFEEIKDEDPLSPDTDVSCASVDYEIKTKPNEPVYQNLDSKNCRPIRNRIKVLNKDFVYDLSDLLKKEAEAYKESQYTMAYSRFKKRSSSVTQVERLSNKDYGERNSLSTSVSPTNSMNEIDRLTNQFQNDIFVKNEEIDSLEDKNSDNDMDSENKSLCLPPEQDVLTRTKDSLNTLQTTDFKDESYKSNDSLEDITVIPVNISSNSADDDSSSSDEMPLLEVNMSQDPESNEEESIDPLEAENVVNSDPESSCPDITGENYEPAIPVQFEIQPRPVNCNRSLLKPSSLKQNTDNKKRLNKVYIRKPSGDLQEIIFEAPISIETEPSILYESQNQVNENSEIGMNDRNHEPMNSRDKDSVLRIINESLPLESNSIIASDSESDMSDDDY